MLAAWIVGGTALAADSTVRIESFTFTPGSVTVNIGDTVTWRNDDTAGHTATAASEFDTGAIAPGATAEITFATAGTFAYVCSIHPQMSGTVVVEAGGAGLTPAPTDTVPLRDEPTSDPTAVVAFLLAVLGVAMLAGSRLIDRRTRETAAAPAEIED
jgi:plastocyanin